MRTREKRWSASFLLIGFGSLTKESYPSRYMNFQVLSKRRLGTRPYSNSYRANFLIRCLLSRALYRQPSFESMKYGLTLAWMLSTLGLDIENADHRVLIDGLFTIAQKRKMTSCGRLWRVCVEPLQQQKMEHHHYVSSCRSCRPFCQ